MEISYHGQEQVRDVAKLIHIVPSLKGKVSPDPRVCGLSSFPVPISCEPTVRNGLLVNRVMNCGESAMRAFQIIFNPTSAAELSRMPKELQLEILGQFRGLPQEILKSDLERFGKLERRGRILHRFRLGDYRIYFERHELGVVVHRILSRNSLKDFLFRSSLPTGEDEALQDNPKFWELIEAARSASA